MTGFFRIFVSFLTLCWIGLLLSGCNQTTSQQLPKQQTFFYGKECPHCKTVEKYIAEHKLQLATKEVYHNRANMQLLVFIVRNCNPQAKAIELPLLWTGNSCVIGEQPVLRFLKEHLNAQT